MGKSDSSVHVHVVHSMKGGCGKTAFSLFKAINLAYGKISETDENSKWDDKARILYIDADFRGTSLKYLIYDSFNAPKDPMGTLTKEEVEKNLTGLSGNKENCEIAISRKYKNGKNNIRNKNMIQNQDDQSICLNDYLLSNNTYQISDLFAEAVIYEKQPRDQYNLNGRIDFIFSSPKMDAKNMFRYGRGQSNGFGPGLTDGRFANMMGTFLRYVLKKGRGTHMEGDKCAEGQYTDIIIDMPPGYDSYSELLVRELRKLKNSGNIDIELLYYSVSTNDRGHLYSLQENLADIEQNSADESIYDKVNAVLCCMEGNDEGSYKVVEESLRSEAWWNSDRNQLFLVPFYEEYRKFCREASKISFSCGIKIMKDGTLQDE